MCRPPAARDAHLAGLPISTIWCSSQDGGDIPAKGQRVPLTPSNDMQQTLAPWQHRAKELLVLNCCLQRLLRTWALHTVPLVTVKGCWVPAVFQQPGGKRRCEEQHARLMVRALCTSSL